MDNAVKKTGEKIEKAGEKSRKPRKKLKNKRGRQVLTDLPSACHLHALEARRLFGARVVDLAHDTAQVH